MNRRVRYFLLTAVSVSLVALGLYVAPPAQAASVSLSISKTDGQTTDFAGSTITYTIVGSNAGPDTTTSARIADTFPAAVTGVTSTCVASMGSSCGAAIPNGNINKSDFVIAAGGTVTITSTGTISPTFTGLLENTAQIFRNAADTNTGGVPSSKDQTTILAPQGDLSVTKTDGLTQAAPGETVTFTIVFSNAGPSPATDAQITDFFPEHINESWSCTGTTGGAMCPSPTSGTGNLNLLATFPANSSITYTATATIPSNETGVASNTAAINAPMGFTDTNTANNNVKDDTTLVPSADLVVSKDCEPETVVPGQTYDCTITVENQGPSDAQNISVSDDLPTGTTLVGTPAGGGWTCNTADPFTCTRTTLVASTSTTISYTVRVNDDVGPGQTLTNSVTATSSTADPNTPNTASDAVQTPTCTIDFQGATQGQTIVGTSGDDVICGSPFSDNIQGLGGNDIIFGLGGNDNIEGGGGDDTIFGGDGDDNIQGNGGHDTLFGGNGNDNMSGGSGNDELRGGEGNDILQGEGGDDDLFGEGGNDTLMGDGGSNTNDGGPGTDNCAADEAVSTVNCNP